MERRLLSSRFMTARFVAGTIVAMTLLISRAQVRADQIAGDDRRLDAALGSSPIVRNFNRIAVLLAGDRAQAGLAARSALVAALRAGGHEVDVDEESIPDAADRARVSRIAAVHRPSAVATVRISTVGGPEQAPTCRAPDLITRPPSIRALNKGRASYPGPSRRSVSVRW